MRAIRFALPLVLFFLAATVVRAEEKEVKIVTSLSVDSFRGDSLFIDEEYKVCVKPASVTFETIPAVYKDDVNGKKVLVLPEAKRAIPIPAIFETRTRMMKLLVEGDVAAKAKELAAKSAQVEIAGLKTEGGFKVTSIAEKK